MDNLTHTLFGITLGRTALGRAGRGTTAALIIASSAPDIDIVTTAGGTGSYLTWHRGPTHGPLGVVGLGVLTALLVWMGRRYLDSRRDAATKSPHAVTPANGHDPTGMPTEPQNASFGMLVIVSTIGVLMHVLMDLPTPYGTRLLSPFDWHWFAADWMPIIDLYLLIVLAAGLLFGSLSPAARRRNAVIALVLMAANYGVRAVAHDQALEKAPRLFGPLLPQPCAAEPDRTGVLSRWPRPPVQSPQHGKRCLVELVAIPTFFSPFNWRVIAHLSDAFEIHDIDLLEPRFRDPADESEVLWRTTVRFPNVWTPPVFMAASSSVGRAFLGFARLPAARSVVDDAGIATVRWTDMRFVAALAPLDRPAQGNRAFTVRIRIAPDGRIVQEQFGQ
jgi:membrane-bound metal-dependent hydrolase YbcI (DUF457 family)